ncbi:---NA--- [Paramuricea clavata]|uniref:---NA n=1 Tax=Paramuricea clavata TaxID=317549 RepID=A0A7D9EHK4_PARCT|nr:---NA--- [Paramuricea clavata]
MYGGYGRRDGFPRRGYPGGYHRSYNETGCMFCTGVPESQQSHQRRQCREFHQLKQKTSYKPYVKAKLRDQDEQGFAAAGFLLWKRKNENNLQVLMAREYRDGSDLLNFLGGKRLRKAESAIEVALRKVDMESGRQLSRNAFEGMKHAPLVHWSGRSASKYALFLYEVTSWRDCKVDVQAAGLRGDGVKRLEWVCCKNLKSSSFIHRELHDFAKDMVQALSDPTCDVLANIEELFETAKTAGEANKVKDDTQEKVLFDFDVIAALTSSANLAKGFSTTGNLTWGNIADAVKLLHKNDIKKLQLKYHPDHLRRHLERDPTDLEKEASTKAMQILNRILEMVKEPSKAPNHSSSSGDVFTTIKELNELIKTYTDGDDDDCDDKIAAAVTAKLSEIKLR